MQNIEPFLNWEKYYCPNEDPQSPFYGVEYNLQYYEKEIYGYYIHPLWDYIGSETLYIKVLYADYHLGFVVVELMGELNDTLHNDSMFLKRNVIDPMLAQGINKFILLADNLLQFHGGDDDYYAEWFDDVEDGWIAGLNFRDFIQDELQKYELDSYINFGGTLDIHNWRTHNPRQLYKLVEKLIVRRLN